MRRHLTYITAAFLLASTISLNAASPEEGKQLFKANCNACHHMDMRLVGPPLKNVHIKHPEEWLLSFIKSSTSMIEAGDSTAIDLYNTYNKVLMPDQNLTDDEIRSILAYIEQESQPKSGDDPFPRPEVVRSDAKPLAFTDFRFWIIYTVAVLLTIVAVYYKAELTTLQSSMDSEKKEGEDS